jgi:hypothetical protein
MCFPVNAHGDDCDCSACLVRKEQKRKWRRAMKNPALLKQLEIELAAAKAEGWQSGYTEARRKHSRV